MKFDVLGVYLQVGKNEVRVGSLVRDQIGMIRFDVDESYIALGEYRPIFSSSLLRVGDEEDTQRLLRGGEITRAGRDVPPWFANLLPEGALRDLVLKGMPTGTTSNFDVLRWLGSDLPGAVIIRDEGANPLPTISPGEPSTTRDIRFSLAGVQLKMSMQKQDERLTIPAMGGMGNIIAKLPSERYRALVENEYSSMKLAQAAGVTIPELELVPTSNLEGVDADLLKGGSLALAVKRFDRTNDGGRTHIEDFLQILGAMPDRKYAAANEETVMRVATRLGGGTNAFLEAVRRIVVNIILGNTDAHVKNWSLWYPSPATGQLSPAYDIVATVVYDQSESMALRFRSTHDSRIIDTDGFKRAASFVGVSEAKTRREVRQVVEQAADTWATMLEELPMPDDQAAIIIQRSKSLAVMQEFEKEL
jgi:serine/threonine-protein kinase HipA